MDFTDAKSSRPEFSVWDCCFVNGLSIYPLLSYLATAGAVNLLLITFLIPISAILLGITFLDESLLPKHLVGIALIVTGMSVVDSRPWKKLKVLWTVNES